MSTGFGFKFDDSKVDGELYGDRGEGRYPSIVWHGKYAAGGDSGYWTLSREESDAAPGPFWAESEVRFGSNPNGDVTPVWMTYKLRVCVLAVRKRITITGEDGGIYHYPWLTPKNERQPGKYMAHHQVAVTMPDTGERIFVLGLRGFTKTASWSNPAGGKWSDSRFPVGAEHLLKAYAKAASKEIGSNIPAYCSFWTDLVGYTNEKGKPGYVDVGYKTFALPFTADFSVSEELPHRFVGMDRFIRHQQIRKDVLADWEKEWLKREDESGESVDVFSRPAPVELEGAEMPF